MCVTSQTRGEEAEEVLDPDNKEPEIRCLMLSHRCCHREKEKPTKMLSLHYPKEQRGLTLSERTDAQLARSGYFIQLQG